jgi:hypothetical protein
VTVCLKQVPPKKPIAILSKRPERGALCRHADRRQEDPVSGKRQRRERPEPGVGAAHGGKDRFSGLKIKFELMG